jgi:hypothetical protein
MMNGMSLYFGPSGQDHLAAPGGLPDEEQTFSKPDSRVSSTTVPAHVKGRARGVRKLLAPKQSECSCWIIEM